MVKNRGYKGHKHNFIPTSGVSNEGLGGQWGDYQWVKCTICHMQKVEQPPRRSQKNE